MPNKKKVISHGDLKIEALLGSVLKT